MTSTSKTVEEESYSQLTEAINRIVDIVNPSRKWQVKAVALDKCSKRLQELFSFTKLLSLKVDESPVRIFYNNLLNDPTTKQKLMELRKKKNESRLLPEDSDLRILQEAISLKKEGNSVCFVSKDGHFCEFKTEIENSFSIKVLPVVEIQAFLNAFSNS
jgi:hypothetical protein